MVLVLLLLLPARTASLTKYHDPHTQGIQKARDVGFIDWNSGNSTWSLEEYEHYEQVGPCCSCSLRWLLSLLAGWLPS